MSARSRLLLAGAGAKAEVATPQVKLMGWYGCPTPDHLGPGKMSQHCLAVFRKLGPGVADTEVPQEGRSSGCQRADASFWFWQWQLPSPLAPRKKKKSWSNRSRSSLSLPASTSKLSGRACQQPLAKPAPTQVAPSRTTDGGNPTSLKNIMNVDCLVWAGMLLSDIGSACHTDRRTPGC